MLAMARAMAVLCASIGPVLGDRSGASDPITASEPRRQGRAGVQGFDPEDRRGGAMPSAVVAVAYSAGRDSTALLHATWRAALAQGGLRVAALHVHHGLSAFADDWLDHARKQCRDWAAEEGAPLSFLSRRLPTRPAAGESVEAWARRERYRALAGMAREAGASIVLLAHHRQDQAETFLLQALRGAGPAGLSGMAQQASRDGIAWVRPWLCQPRRSIQAYVDHHRLRHVEDDSNAEARFARNRLRLKVWPALCEAFPQAEGALADAAARAQQADAALRELAELDMAATGATDGVLPLRAWAALSPARRGNLLRAWLLRQPGLALTSALLVRLMDELHGAGPASWPAGAGQLRRYRGRLTFSTDEAPSGRPSAGAAPENPAREVRLSITRPGAFPLPQWGGVLHAEPVAEGGVPLAWLGALELKARGGGERFQAGIGRPARSLKKQYQAAAVPEWARSGPLVYSGGQLVFVPGLGLDARVLALPGQEQVGLQWVASGT